MNFRIILALLFLGLLGPALAATTTVSVGNVAGSTVIVGSSTSTVTAPTPSAGNNSTNIATTAFVATSFAPLASPALTGTPTAPTASASDNSTKIATTAYVDAAASHSVFSWSWGSVAANTTAYLVPGGLSTGGVNLNTGGLATRSGTFRNMYLRTSASPGAGLNYTFTLMVGTPAVMTATGVTCAITGASATTCNDTTHTAAITAGQAWAIRIVTDSGAAITSQSMAGIELDD